MFLLFYYNFCFFHVCYMTIPKRPSSIFFQICVVMLKYRKDWLHGMSNTPHLLLKCSCLVVWADVYGCCYHVDILTAHDLGVSWLRAIPLLMHAGFSALSDTSPASQQVFMCSVSYATEGGQHICLPELFE